MQNLPERLQQVFALPGDRDHEKGGQGGPELNPHPVRRGAEKSAQSQVLFEPTKEKFDGPAAAIDQRDDQGSECKLIGEENQRLPGSGIEIADPPQRLGIIRTALGRVESNGLIAAQAGRLVHGTRGHDIGGGVGLKPGDEARPPAHATGAIARNRDSLGR